MFDFSSLLSVPGLDQLVDGVVHSVKWVLKYGRSKDVLILGQGRSGKTSMFYYIKSNALFPCTTDHPMTRLVPNQDKMHTFQEETTHGRINVEIRLLSDLSGQLYPADHAAAFNKLKPHVLFIFLDFTKVIAYEKQDVDNIAYWLEEFFDGVKEHRRSFRKLVRVSFVVTKIDMDITNAPFDLDVRKKAFEEKINNAYKAIPHKIRQKVSKDIYFLSMCYCERCTKNDIKDKLDLMLVQSFVNLNRH